jgi:hypothetical protein
MDVRFTNYEVRCFLTGWKNKNLNHENTFKYTMFQFVHRDSILFQSV